MAKATADEGRKKRKEGVGEIIVGWLEGWR